MHCKHTHAHTQAYPREYKRPLRNEQEPRLRLSSRPGKGSRLGLDSWVTVNADRETRVIVPVPLNTTSTAPAAENDTANAEGATHGIAR